MKSGNAFGTAPVLGVTTCLGAVWLWLLLVARHRVESGRPPSHPGSRASLGWVRSAQAVGGMFGGFLGGSFGGWLETIGLAVALAVFSVVMVPAQKRIGSGVSRQRRIAPTDGEAEHPWDTGSGPSSTA